MSNAKVTITGRIAGELPPLHSLVPATPEVSRFIKAMRAEQAKQLMAQNFSEIERRIIAARNFD